MYIFIFSLHLLLLFLTQCLLSCPLNDILARPVSQISLLSLPPRPDQSLRDQPYPHASRALLRIRWRSVTHVSHTFVTPPVPQFWPEAACVMYFTQCSLLLITVIVSERGSHCKNTFGLVFLPLCFPSFIVDVASMCKSGVPFLAVVKVILIFHECWRKHEAEFLAVATLGHRMQGVILLETLE